VIEAIFNHPVLNPMQVFGAIFFGSLTGSMKDPIVLFGYGVVIYLAFRKVSSFWIGLFIVALLVLRFLLSMPWSTQYGAADAISIDRLFTVLLVFCQMSIAGVLARMVRSVRVIPKAERK
jgi:hypothetical protein